MGLCAYCTEETNRELSLCIIHEDADEYQGWFPEENRIMCDLVHRKWIPTRLPLADRFLYMGNFREEDYIEAEEEQSLFP